MHFNNTYRQNCRGVVTAKVNNYNTYIMSKFNKLSRAEMRNVLGGMLEDPGDKCDSGCVTNSDCTGTKCTSCNNVPNGKKDSAGNPLYDRQCS